MSDSNGTDEYDIHGMELEDAKEYILAVMTTLKGTAAKRVQLERDQEMWEKRVELAVEKGRQDLVEGAAGKVEQIKEDIARLRGEEQEYAEGLSRMRSQLKMMQSQPKMSVDVDLLNAQMDMLLGETEKSESETDDKFRKAQAEWALDELKRKMQGENE